jgi:hypothetical protein
MLKSFHVNLKFLATWFLRRSLNEPIVFLNFVIISPLKRMNELEFPSSKYDLFLLSFIDIVIISPLNG